MKLSCILVLNAAVMAADVVTDWNTVALDAIRAGNTPPPAAARNLAILHASIYDGVNGIRRTHKPYFVAATGPNDASIEAAASAAARRVLLSLYPALQRTIESEYQNSLHRIPDNARKSQGIQWGEFVALAVLQSRSSDGSSNSIAYTPGTQPGQWRPTISFGGVVRPALLPHWGSVRPFALAAGTQFRPPLPPPLDSPQYAADWNMVKAIGGLISSTRTTEQTQIAQFWGYGPGTATPPGHWNQIAQAVANRDNGRDGAESSAGHGRSSVEENARLFALLNIALADAAIISWDCKYVYNYWRPITAIHEAASDGNSATEPDLSWMPLLPTPPFPEYTSGHSTFSSAAAVVLAYFFGSDRIRFSVGSDDLPGVRRSYRSFSEAAQESGISRVYGGIHFPSANVHGLSTGAAVGIYVAWNFLTPL
ncbi:MAG TPA: vanadium-dependent haloperoxidase [Bryobacteraceae bacterium]|nr:vanadium-dependent haloperoxidase [Bryobacteraceae bacterium]